MRRLKTCSLSVFVVFCMLFANIAQVIFATDYNRHWAKGAIDKWAEKGLVAGYEDGTFRPSNAITRAELATILVRSFKFQETTNAKDYIDVKDDKWYAENIKLISSVQVMNDDGEYFRPEDSATREEAAYALSNAYKITNTMDERFKDESDASKWAISSISALSSRGFISGNPDGTFKPKRTLTRADIVAMLDKIMAQLINKPGSYTGDIEGNLVINTKDVVLKDMKIIGDLYLTEGIGHGNVVLQNVVVEGRTFINGGGVTPYQFKDSSFMGGIEISINNPISLYSETEGQAPEVEVLEGTELTLTGRFGDVKIPRGTNVVIKDGWVWRIIVRSGFLEEGKGLTETVIDVEEIATLVNIRANAPAEIKGKGIPHFLVVNSNGVKTEQTPQQVIIAEVEFKVQIAGEEVIHQYLLEKEDN